MGKTLFSRILCFFLAAGFFFGIHNGRIGIWKDGQATPYRVIPCPVFLLSQAQQDALAAGIRVDTMEDVDRLIRDFFA